MKATVQDITDMPESERIERMGTLAALGATIGFVVEDDAKADRYIKALLLEYRIRVIGRGPGPVAGTILVRIGPVEAVH